MVNACLRALRHGELSVQRPGEHDGLWCHPRDQKSRGEHFYSLPVGDWGHLGALVMVLSRGLGVQRVRGMIGAEHAQY